MSVISQRGIQIEHVGATICKCRMKEVHHVEKWIQISASAPCRNVDPDKCIILQTWMKYLESEM